VTTLQAWRDTIPRSFLALRGANKIDTREVNKLVEVPLTFLCVGRAFIFEAFAASNAILHHRSRRYIRVSQLSDGRFLKYSFAHPCVVSNVRNVPDHISLGKTVWLPKKTMQVYNGCVFAWTGNIRIGNIWKMFEPLDMAVPLPVVSISPMELTIRDSYFSMRTTCVQGFGRWLLGERHCVQNDIWLGVSLGVLGASEAVPLCEAAVAQPWAMVALDSRKQFPIL